MSCPHCGSQNLRVTSNINESACNTCGCEYKETPEGKQIFANGDFNTFMENVTHQICEGVADPMIRTALKTSVKGFLNEGYQALPAYVQHLVTEAESLYNQYQVGLREKEDFGAVMEGINALVPWIKLHESEYPDYDNEFDVDDVADDDFGAEYDDGSSDLDDAIDSLGIDVSDYADVGMDEMESPIDDIVDVACGAEVEDPAMMAAPTGGMLGMGAMPVIGDVQTQGGLPNSNDIALDRAQDAASELTNALADLEDEEAPEPAAAGMGFYESSNYAFKVGDSVYMNNDSSTTYKIIAIHEGKVVGKSEYGDTQTVDLSDEYRESDIQFSHEEHAAVVMERAEASAQHMKDKWAAFEKSLLEGETVDSGLGHDDDTGMGLKSDEGSAEAAEKTHDMDGEVTSSVEDADAESDGPDYAGNDEDTRHGDQWGLKKEGFDGYVEDTAGPKVIRTSYAKWAPSDIEIGDTDDKGWEDEEGQPMASAEEAVQWLQDAYITSASSSEFHPGIWYSSTDEDISHTGEPIVHERSFHLDGFSEEEEAAIYNALATAGVLRESVIGDHFHAPDGTKMPFPFTQDPTNSASADLKKSKLKAAEDETDDAEKESGLKGKDKLEETALKGLRVGDIINRSGDFKTQWDVVKITRHPVKVHLKSGTKTSVLDPIREGFQFIDGVSLGYERNTEGVTDTRKIWEALEESFKSEKDLCPLNESAMPLMVAPSDSEVQYQSGYEDGESNEEPASDDAEYMKGYNDGQDELRGNMPSVNAVSDLMECTKKELYHFVKDGDYHRLPRTTALYELNNKFTNKIEEMEEVLDDAVMSLTDEAIDETYGATEQLGELQTEFALKNAWAQMEEEIGLVQAAEDQKNGEMGGNPRTSSDEQDVMRDMGAGSDVKINLNENRNLYGM